MVRLTLFFWLLGTAVFGQQLIEGQIVDKETGKPVSFASIGIVGTSKGTSSNLNGEFTLKLADQGSIKISCIGYESKILQVDGESIVVELKPSATQLREVVIFNRPVNPRKIVYKAFTNTRKNFDNHGFMQKFFYRHYCKDDSVYGRLIEASVDVWKNNGYRASRKYAGERESVRITQLRRSLDKTKAAQGHDPISVASILQADFVGYQLQDQNAPVKFYSDVSNLRGSVERYTFDFDGITTLDGQEVYKINYAQKKDSVLTTTGYINLPTITGALFITTDNYAFVKTEETKSSTNNLIKTTAYYSEFDDKFYPYHLLIEGENKATEISSHEFHIELISVEIHNDTDEKFDGEIPSREELLKIPYDSSFWKNSTVLKTTPLEEDIIKDLGNGLTLNEQFLLYRQYQWNTTNGAVDGEGKLKWLIEYSKNKNPLAVFFWSGNPFNYILDIEHFKRLSQVYRNKITFLFIGIEHDAQKWKETVTKYNLFSDGILNYKIDSSSEVLNTYKVQDIPTIILLTKSGKFYPARDKRPSDPQFVNELNTLLTVD